MLNRGTHNIPYMPIAHLKVSLLASIQRLWRTLLPTAGRLTDRYLLILLKARIAGRKLLRYRRNSFAALHPTEIPIVVINLATRPDRLKDVVADLRRVGFVNVTVLRAFDGPERYPSLARGHASNLGCAESHMAAVYENLLPGQPVAVCEDDNQFLEEPKHILNLIREFLDADDFDVLCLASRVRGPKVVVSPDFQVVAWALAPSFYIVKPRSKVPLLRAYRKSIRLLGSERRRGPFDQVWRVTQRYSLLFVRPNKKVARQKESYSDIQAKYFGGT